MSRSAGLSFLQLIGKLRYTKDGDCAPPRPWDVLIVDEGHQIKNPSCQSGRSLRRIHARSRILLTGPPA
eukprot:Skav217850  [mRNA]  locus=scaffold3024:135374:135580:+ [translate_table: standard]